jgi:hypothetical protein
MNRQEAFQQLLAGTIEVLRIEPDGELYFGAPPPGLILSGAFNPLHAGHIALAKSAAWLVGREPLFELAVLNADKGAIAAEEIERRAAQFSQRYPLLLSREPLFTRKALLYPGSDFALGYDTAARLIEPHYYGGPAALAKALDLVRRNRCRFVVAGRLVADQFRTLKELSLPPAYRDLFVELPEDVFRVDLSSSQLRENRA